MFHKTSINRYISTDRQGHCCCVFDNAIQQTFQNLSRHFSALSRCMESGLHRAALKVSVLIRDLFRRRATG